MPLWGRDWPFLALADPLPASLSPAGDGLVRSLPALLWYLLSPLFCEWAWQCLRQGFSLDSSLSLSLFFFFFSLSLAIPQFGLLSHVSSLRLLSGHSGSVLTLSNAAHTSLFSPRLLVANSLVWATSLLEVAVRRIICVVVVVCLFVCLPSQLCCPLRFQNFPQTRQ